MHWMFLIWLWEAPLFTLWWLFTEVERTWQVKLDFTVLFVVALLTRCYTELMLNGNICVPTRFGWKQEPVCSLTNGQINAAVLKQNHVPTPQSHFYQLHYSSISTAPLPYPCSTMTIWDFLFYNERVRSNSFSYALCYCTALRFLVAAKMQSIFPCRSQGETGVVQVYTL